MNNLSGIFAIQEERMRQQIVEGFDPEHDGQHIGGEIAEAAACYAQCAATQEYWKNRMGYGGKIATMYSVQWPWDSKWWKPNEDPLVNLVKAGALIAAEIDRIKRKKQRENTD